MLIKARKIELLTWASAFLTLLACGLHNHYEKPNHAVGTVLSLVPAEQQVPTRISALQLNFLGAVGSQPKGVVEFFGYNGESKGRFDLNSEKQPSCLKSIDSHLSPGDTHIVFCHGELDLSQVQGVKYYGDRNIEKSATQISLIGHKKEKSLTIYSATL